MSTAKCARCGGEAYLMQPEGFKGVKLPHKIFACPACGANTSENGKVLVSNLSELKELSMIAAKSRDMAREFAGDKLGPAGHALFQARMAEFALQMWFDGYKHGLLTEAVSKEYERRHGGNNEQV